MNTADQLENIQFVIEKNLLEKSNEGNSYLLRLILQYGKSCETDGFCKGYESNKPEQDNKIPF